MRLRGAGLAGAGLAQLLFMKIIYIMGVLVRLFWTGVVQVISNDHAQSLAILAYMNDEGMLEQEFFNSLFPLTLF